MQTPTFHQGTSAKVFLKRRKARPLPKLQLRVRFLGSIGAMEEGRSEEENSMFETSHVLGNLLACSPLLAQSWQKCAAADAAAASGFVADVHGGGGGTAYVAFSRVHAALSVGPAAGGAEIFAPVGLGSGAARALFAPLVAAEAEIGEPVVVQALALRSFLSLCNSPEFQMVLNQIRGKAVVFTGHSLGGAIASLAALHYLCGASANSTCSSTPPLLCVTFGSPLLGNEALSRAILRERWGGNFCHVVSQHDVVPRLLFCPLDTISPLLVARMQLQKWRAARPRHVTADVDEREELHKLIHMHVGALAMEQKLASPTLAQDRSPYRPFGTYALCSSEGAVCVDNPTAVVQMLYVTFVSRWSPTATTEAAHLCYGDLVLKMPQHFLLKKAPCVDDEPPGSNYEAGISLALEASGVGVKGMEAIAAGECLKMSKRMGRSPNLNCANLAIKLGKITPCRAQIEWYKASFDDDTGYYDAFKLRRSPKKYTKANMNRIKLGHFWDGVLAMLESNQLPHDFPKRAKWVNAAHFYKLLVEPLDIAEYYRNNLHKTRGEYIAHGRERRYEVFDKWWKEKDSNEAAARRSKYAGLTQDSCFWAKVEEAKEWVESVKSESDDASKLAQNLRKLRDFEWYSKKLVERKEVSIDVLAPHSSYTLWAEEWKEVTYAIID